MKPRAARYAASFFLIVVVLLLRFALQARLGLSVPYLQFFPAVMLAAWLGGTGPGLLAVVLAAAASDFFFLGPTYSFAIAAPADRLSLPLFVLIGLAIVWLFERVRHSERAHELAAVRAAEQALELSRLTRRLSDVVANVPGVVWEAWGEPDATSQRIDFVSEHVRSLLGYGPEEWTKTPNFWLSVVHPDDRARAAAESRAIFESGANGRNEFRWIRKDGRVIWVEAHSSVVLDERGRPIGMRGVTLDVSSRRNLERERAGLLERAEQARAEAVNANRLKDDFLATLSHELRTPLNAILGYGRMLRQGVVEPDRQARAFEIIERNAASLTQMVGDVLDVSRIVGGKIRLNVQSVDLPVVVEEAVATIRNAADAKGVRLQVVVDPAGGPISGDPDRVQQIIWNLMSNAVRFTPKEGRVQLRLERVNSHVEIVVSDTGIGITPEFLPHVFERFRQADSRFSRQHGGLGLGLAITRDLVQLHGGTIEAFSEGQGHGATFRVQLPLMIVQPKRDSAERTHPATGGRHLVAPPATLAGVRVLAVDDEGDALTLVRDVLEAAGATVMTADSAERALQALANGVPDVMITDLGMPKMDGFALLEAVRASPDEAVRGLPVAALTAYARSEDRTRALRSGFQMHLAKPIDPAELVASVSALARRRSTSSTALS
jgi:PAS domain S-box-containing protein